MPLFAKRSNFYYTQFHSSEFIKNQGIIFVKYAKNKNCIRQCGVERLINPPLMFSFVLFSFIKFILFFYFSLFSYCLSFIIFSFASCKYLKSACFYHRSRASAYYNFCYNKKLLFKCQNSLNWVSDAIWREKLSKEAYASPII